MDGKTALVKNFNFEENVPKVYTVLSIYFIDFHEIYRIVCEWHGRSKYFANFMKIDEIDAEHCDGKL